MVAATCDRPRPLQTVGSVGGAPGARDLPAGVNEKLRGDTAEIYYGEPAPR